jgi:adenylate cyclase
MSTSRQRRLATKAAVAIGVALLAILMTQERLLKLGIIERLELATIDYRFGFRGANPAIRDSAHVVIVEIGEESFRSLPAKFPWPRSYYAHLVRNLRAAGARAVGIDLIFDTGDVYAGANDEDLRRAIRETHIAVLAGKREQDDARFITTSSLENFSNIFYPVDSCLGLVNIRADVDGVYRFYNTSYLVPAGADSVRSVPTFGFALLNKYLCLPPATVPQRRDGEFLYAGRTIPPYDPASLLINFYGPSGTFRHMQFQDVIDDESLTTTDEAATGEQINTFSDPDYGYLYDGTFVGKIVLVGVTVPEYKDLFPVSLGRGTQRGDNLMYGVELHANLVENVLRNDFLTRQSPKTEAAVVFVLAAFTFLLVSWIKGAKTRHSLLVEVNSLLAVVAELVVIVSAALALFVHENYVLTVISPIVAVATGYVASTTFHFISERKQRLLIKSMFSTYVNPSVVDELISHPEKLVLGGRREELTVLFSDIEGFTTISQDMLPEELVAILNEYLSAMSEIIFTNDGTLDKYEGDAIMAFWGAPIPQEDHALRACLSALAMQEALAHIHTVWREQQKPLFNMRIGINTGEMVVGNMGAAGKFAYTVIGDSVNLASRLEGANKEYRTGIMVSQRTYDLVRRAIVGRELDRITVKGRSEPVTTYELLGSRDGPGMAPVCEKFLPLYDEGMAFYYSRRWRDAAARFTDALRARPGDYPSILHLERIRAYEAAPPGDNWNGVFAMKTK